MAGYPSIAPPEPATSPRPASGPELSEAWRQVQPFAALPHSARLAWQRESGMHGDAGTSRIGTDAFEIRQDLTVGDACETAAQLLKAIIGALDVLAVAPDAAAPHQHALAGCAFLARQVAGSFAVIAASLFSGNSKVFASNDS